MSRSKVKLTGDLQPPVAIVKKPRLVKLGPVDPGMRRGRGFSLGELKEAGFTVEEARRLGIYVDRRRRSVHPWNVEALKDFRKKLKEKQG